ncbi:hypothetical protein HID58_007105 [Brassica napus]|uniref:F-box associated beta-propeller type 1 domain-containing protein n=1 Tax=Brassica napus TaxID=3708 RepID=A0ABQ8EDA2_BRANA|nr:hypothetical protein HID58_007105 [Brassica napus]
MFPTLKRHREELLRLPEDVVELILERLPERQQLIHMSRGPDILFVSTNVYDDDGRLVKRVNDLDARRFAFGSSSAYTVHVPTNWGGTSVCHSNCDGLLCLYSIYNPSVCVVMNPATRWHGSLYWLTDCEEEPKVLSFDLHTETFYVICDAPFAHVLDPWSVTICILDNRLCVSKKAWPTQDIWSFQYSNMTWTKMCSIDLTQTFSWLGEPEWSLEPIAILDKHKLLLQGRDYRGAIFILDLLTNSYHLLVKPSYSPISLCYSQSLFSV